MKTITLRVTLSFPGDSDHLAAKDIVRLAAQGIHDYLREQTDEALVYSSVDVYDPISQFGKSIG